MNSIKPSIQSWEPEGTPFTWEKCSHLAKCTQPGHLCSLTLLCFSAHPNKAAGFYGCRLTAAGCYTNSIRKIVLCPQVLILVACWLYMFGIFDLCMDSYLLCDLADSLTGWRAGLIGCLVGCCVSWLADLVSRLTGWLAGRLGCCVLVCLASLVSWLVFLAWFAEWLVGLFCCIAWHV